MATELLLRFETHRYFLIPHLCVSEYVVIANQLLALTPSDGPIELDQAAEELRFRAKRAEIRMASLADEYDREAELREVEFEARTDDLGHMIDGCFGYWALIVSMNSGGDDPKSIDKRELAARARVIHENLFGEDGLDFCRLGYRQRFATLSAMFRSIKHGELDPRADELIIGALAEGRINLLGESYELQLDAHLRERDESRSLANHRVALRWAIAAYDEPLSHMADRWSKESCDRINAMIMPLQDACTAAHQRKMREVDEKIERLSNLAAQEPEPEPSEGDA